MLVVFVKLLLNMLIYFGIALTLFCTKVTGQDDITTFKKLILDVNQISNAWKAPVKNVEFKNSKKNSCEDFGQFDFVIVGSGPAGSVMARRLSEISKWNILLIEAGYGNTTITDIPALLPQNLKSNLNWGYTTVPQNDSCFFYPNNQCNYARGKGLGGTSLINGMMYVRGKDYDFQNWERLVSSDWNYENVLRYYKKSENAHGFNREKEYHGENGPLSVSESKPAPSLTKRVLEANIELGYKDVDSNGVHNTGVSRTQQTLIHGKRQNAYEAFVEPVLDRTNLHVLTGALATKIYFKNKKARYLKFLYKNKCGYMKIGKELIISAGIINTVQLLQLSGIGPSDDLTRLGTPVFQDLPVGKYLMDRPRIVLEIKTNYSLLKQTVESSIKDYFKGEGVFTYAAAFAYTFLRDDKNINQRLVELAYQQRVNFNSFENYDNNFNKMSIFVEIIEQHPKSVGNIILNSKSPLDFPLINPDFLRNKQDLDPIYSGIMFLEKLIKTKALMEIKAEIVKPSIKICEDKNTEGDIWMCSIPYMAETTWHPVGTCRMGRLKKNSVVNSKLLVHGIKNLRIVDASVFPAIISGHPVSAVYMVAENAADMIKRTLKCNSITPHYLLYDCLKSLFPRTNDLS